MYENTVIIYFTSALRGFVVKDMHHLDITPSLFHLSSATHKNAV